MPTRPQLIVYKHLVEIENSSDEGRVPPNELKEKLLKEFLEEHNESLVYAYDLDRILYTKRSVVTGVLK